MRQNDPGGIIFEFISMGRFVKVSAIDTASGVEVSIVGDPAAGEVALRQLAARKLQMVMRKQAGKQQTGGSQGGGFFA
jgi:hypothetical protein